MQLFYAGKTNKQKAFDALVYLFRTSNSPQEHPFFVFIKLDLHNSPDSRVLPWGGNLDQQVT